jgi:hypothetical protein
MPNGVHNVPYGQQVCDNGPTTPEQRRSPGAFLAVGSTGDLDTATLEENAMPYPHSIHIPTRRSDQHDCAARSPRNNYSCNRPAGHTGRHLFAHRHVDGLVREVWA